MKGVYGVDVFMKNDIRHKPVIPTCRNFYLTIHLTVNYDQFTTKRIEATNNYLADIKLLQNSISLNHIWIWEISGIVCFSQGFTP